MNQTSRNFTNSNLLLIIITLFAAGSFFNSAQAQTKMKGAVIAFYNQENLFDTINDPTINDEEFLPTGPNGWTSERYKEKVAHMSYVISQIGEEIMPGGPTILGVSEIENDNVLTDLINSDALKNAGYNFVYVNGPDRRGVDVAMLYRSKDFTVTNVVSAPLRMASDTGWRSRDQLVVTGLLDGETISIIVNHWPSRGNQPPYRAAAAALTRELVDSLYAIDANAKIFIMGDLNDDPVDVSVKDVLGAKGKREQVKRKELYNPMWKMFKDGIGSLAYRDSWNIFDQIILSEPLINEKTAGWKLFKTNVFNRKFLISQSGQYAGYPFRTFSNGNYAGGYSDHLPVYVVITKEIK